MTTYNNKDPLIQKLQEEAKEVVSKFKLKTEEHGYIDTIIMPENQLDSIIEKAVKEARKEILQKGYITLRDDPKNPID